MNQVRVEYKFIVFLYAYLRQIDLSIDRTRWVPWVDLRNYYVHQISPLKVTEQILGTIGLDAPPMSILYFVDKNRNLNMMHVKGVLNYILRRHQLTVNEILYCSQLLHEFNDLLYQDFPKYPLEAERLRLNIACFYDYVLCSKLLPREVYRAEKIEHFLQHDDTKVTSISVFADDVLKARC